VRGITRLEDDIIMLDIFLSLRLRLSILIAASEKNVSLAPRVSKCSALQPSTSIIVFFGIKGRHLISNLQSTWYFTFIKHNEPARVALQISEHQRAKHAKNRPLA
jgi:hypothetical protein